MHAGNLKGNATAPTNVQPESVPRFTFAKQPSAGKYAERELARYEYESGNVTVALLAAGEVVDAKGKRYNAGPQVRVTINGRRPVNVSLAVAACISAYAADKVLDAWVRLGNTDTDGDSD